MPTLRYSPRWILPVLTALVFDFVPNVSAAPPTPTPKPNILYQAANSRVTERLSQNEAILLSLANQTKSFGLDLSGLIVPGAAKENELAVPDMQPFVTWLSAAKPHFLSEWFVAKHKIVDFDAEKNPQPKTSRYCTTITQTFAGRSRTSTEVTENLEISQPVPWIPPFIQLAEMFNSFVGKFKKTPNTAGKLDYNQPPRYLDSITTEECGRHNTAEEQLPLTVPIVANASLGPAARMIGSVGQVLVAIPSLIDQILNIQTTATITRTSVLSNAEQFCNAGACNETDVRIAPNAKQLVENQGFPMALLSKDFQQTEHFGGIDNPIQIGGRIVTVRDPNLLTKAAETLLTRTACAVTPANEINNVTIGGKGGIAQACSTPLPTATCGTTELPSLLAADGGSCSLCNTNDLNNYVSRFGYPKIPPTLIAILNAAGAAFNVPASVLLSLMYSEGSLERWQWTEENVKKWSVCGGEVPNCDTLASPTGARGPFSFISSEIAPNNNAKDNAGYNWSDDYQDAILIVDPNRNKFSPCNFLDAAFAVAKKLGKESGGSGSYSPATCWEHPFYTYTAGPATSCNWDEMRITTGVRQFTGYCTETAYHGPGGYSGAQTEDENHFLRAIEFYNKYSCH